jgi:hypothetical protein
MTRLRHLVREVAASLEIYLAGRTGQQFNRTAFVLADDCAELASKLFLISIDPKWSDYKDNGNFKRFNDVTAEIRSRFNTMRPKDVQAITDLTSHIESRRKRRNDFFHSAKLLDLTLYPRDCVDAFCDLIDYCALLFPPNPGKPAEGWAVHAAAESDFETCEAILRLDHKAFADPTVTEKLNDILRKLPRSGGPAERQGCSVARFPADFYLRLAIRHGGKELRDRVRTLI